MCEHEWVSGWQKCEPSYRWTETQQWPDDIPTVGCRKCSQAMTPDRFVPCPDVLADNGYPSEAELISIREWPIIELRDIGPLLVYCEDRWEYHYWKRADRRHRRYRGSSLTRRYEISTMGWSGNESIIDALEANTMFWMLCWESSTRGGHYVFEVPAE